MLQNLKDLKAIRFWKAFKSDIEPFIIPPNTELVELITGGCVLEPDEDGVLREYRRGTVFWHVSGEHTVFRTRNEDLYECITFRFETNGPPQRPGNRISAWKNADECVNFARAMLKEFHAEDKNRKLFREYVYAVLTWNAVSGAPGKVCLPEPFRNIHSFIRKNIGTNLTTADLAACCGLSPSYFFSLFHSTFGISPHQYLLKIRIEHAKTLLAGTRLSIKEIAQSCGFDSTEVFYRRFKKETDDTPNGYRRKYVFHP